MSNSPTEFIPEYMEENHGTRVLITNTQADQYLNRKKVKKEVNEESVEPDVYARWCGGKDGFDLLVERLEDN